MKKVYSLLAGLLVFTCSASLLAGPGDTLGVSKETEPIFAPNGVSYLLRYGSLDSGFVFGTLYSKQNNWIGFAQAYTNYDTVEVEKILAFIPYKAKGQSNTPETRMTFRLHKLASDGAISNPGSGDPGQGPSAASLALKDYMFDDIDTSRSGGIHYNIINLDAPVKYKGENIVISVDCSNLKAAGDTVGFLSDAPGSGLGLNYTFHWVQFDGAKYWFWSNPVFGGNLNNNVAVFPVLKQEEIDTTVSLNNIQRYQGIKAILMPNPAQNLSVLKYAVENAGKYTVELISNDGRLLSSTALGYHVAGEYQTEINVSELSAGSYMYSIVNTESGVRYTKTMIVAH